jgi:hypothetical protein
MKALTAYLYLITLYRMSSVQSGFAQVPVNGGNLVAVAGAFLFTPTSAANAKAIKAVMPRAAFLSATAATSNAAGTLFRDMGKSVVLTNATTGLVQDKFRLVTVLNDTDYEGNSQVTGYVRVFAATAAAANTSNAVGVARIG